jgi:hypothetical protein
VESTQRGPSIPSTGGRSDCEPVAITADWNLTSSPPSTAMVFASVNVPFPETIAISLALTTPVMPFTSPSTIPCLLAWAWAKSSSAPETFTPSWAKWPFASFMACAVWTSALVGMHPTVMQVPPTRSASISTTRAPS